MACLSSSLMVSFRCPTHFCPCPLTWASLSFLGLFLFLASSPLGTCTFLGLEELVFPALRTFSPSVANRFSPSLQPDLHPDCSCPWVWGFLRLCAELCPQPHGMSVGNGMGDHHTLGAHCVLSALCPPSHHIPGTTSKDTGIFSTLCIKWSQDLPVPGSGATSLLCGGGPRVIQKY